MFPLEIFPYASLSSSVITTVWVGVIVIGIFNLRLGWVLTGLVVPGYLVPLVIVKPMSAGLIVVESIVTYFVVLFLSESLSSLSRWSSLFGRDRFYALVVSSVLVRLLFDVMLIPVLGDWINLNTDYEFDYRNELQSFGLIIVALMANQYWKTGVARGLFVLAVTGGITWFIIRFGLMEYTNFSIGNLRFMYEDLASSLLSSPKAYIILLTTAYVCSRLNLRYGWDFNGILLPSLLALQWFAPHKILSSFVEAFVILAISRLLLRLPWLARMNMEGARLLLLFFNVSFFYKMLLGFMLPWFWPDLKITDTYGFGYLLATLLALKMHQKDIIGRVSRMTLQASFVSILIASLIGFGLTLLTTQSGTLTDHQADQSTSQPQQIDVSLVRFIDDRKVKLHGSRSLTRIEKPLASEVNAFRMALRDLRTWHVGQPPQMLSGAERWLSSIGYQLSVVDHRYLVLHEKSESRGWGLYVIDSAAGRSVNLQVPHAIDDRWLVDVSLELFSHLHGRTLAISASPKDANRDGSSDMQIEPGTLFHAFHTLIARNSIVQITTHKGNDDKSLVRITDRVPDALDFNLVKTVIGPFEAKWNQRHDENVHKATARGGFVELLLSDKARARVVLMSEQQSSEQSELVTSQTYRQFVMAQQSRYSTPARVMDMTMDEMLYLDRFVVSPLLDLAKQTTASTEPGSPTSSWHQQSTVTERLRLINHAAKTMNYQVAVIPKTDYESSPLLVLYDTNHTQRRWGLVVVRVGGDTSYIVHAGKTTVEHGTLDYSLGLFDGVAASVLTVSPGARRDPMNATPTPGSPLATLVGQIAMRENPSTPMLVVVARAYGVAGKVDVPSTDVLIGLASGEVRPQYVMTPYLEKVVSVLEDRGLSVGFVDGSTATSGYQPLWLPESAYLDATANKELAAVWLSPKSRHEYQPERTVSTIERAFNALGLRSTESSLATRLTDKNTVQVHLRPVDPDLLAALRRYQQSKDIVALRAMTLRWPLMQLEHIRDIETRQDYLVVADEAGRAYAVARLSSSADRKPIVVADFSQPAVLTTLSHPDTSIVVSGED